MSAAPRASERPSPNEGAPLDPVASLFSSDRTLPAPVVAPEVNESEMTRWKSARDSLFGESVKDPPPPAGAGQARSSRTASTSSAEAREGSSAPNAPAVRALSVAKVGEQAPDASASRGGAKEIDLPVPPTSKSGARRVAEDLSVTPELADEMPAPRAKGRAPAPPAQPPVPWGARPDGTPNGTPISKFKTEGKRAKPDAAPGKSAAKADAKGRKKPPPPEKAAATEDRPARRVRRGPKPLVLATLGFAVLMAGGAAAVFLGVVPAPFAQPAPAMPRGVAASRAPLAAKPAAAPVAAAPVAAPPVAAAVPEKSAIPTAAQPAAAATKGKASAPSAPVASSAQPVAKAAPPAAVAAVQPTAKPAAAAPAAEDVSDGAGNEALIGLARKALADEDAAGAEALAKRALAKDANDHHAMEVLARALIDLDRGPEAVTYARRIVEKRKKRVPYRLLLGDALLMVGDGAGARKEWQAALEIDPSNREAGKRLQ